MIIDAGGRQSGKTIRAVEWARSNPDGVIITFSQAEATRLVRDFGLEPEQVVSVASKEALRGEPRTPVYLDNIEMIWASLVSPNTKIVGMSFTEE